MNKFLLFKAILKEVRTSGFLKALAIGNRAERIEVVFFFNQNKLYFIILGTAKWPKEISMCKSIWTI